MSEVRSVLRRLRNAHLTAKPSKCLVGYSNLEYLGHSVGDGFIQPNHSKLEAIQNAPRPETKKQVRSFWGLVGFYRKFVQNFAAITVPLTDLTKSGIPNKVQWNDEHERAFQSLNSMLLVSQILSVGLHPVSSLHVDTFVVSQAFMTGAASQAGDADSSRAPGLTSGLQGSVNVHRGALLLVPLTVHQFFCILHFCHTCSLCRVELVVQFPARGSTQVLLCLILGVLRL